MALDKISNTAKSIADSKLAQPTANKSVKVGTFAASKGYEVGSAKDKALDELIAQNLDSFKDGYFVNGKFVKSDHELNSVEMFKRTPLQKLKRRILSIFDK